MSRGYEGARVNIRFGSLADIAAYSTNVRFTPKADIAGHSTTWLMALARASINFFEMQGNFRILPGIYRQMIRFMASSVTSILIFGAGDE